MSICFLFAATATHVRVYMFRQRPGGHCLFVGRMGMPDGPCADVCIATDMPSVIPTLPGYTTGRLRDDLTTFSTKHPSVWKNITELYNDVGRLLVLRGSAAITPTNTLYKKELEAIKDDRMKLEILVGSLTIITDQLRANEDAG